MTNDYLVLQGTERDMGLKIIFSLRDGYVWASWPETEAAVRLGRHDLVAAMMTDFLAQDALGERLTKCGSGTESPQR